MPPRIAIPLPHSTDREYAERAIPQYERAVELAGGEPVRIPFDRTPAEVVRIVEGCDGVLLPGSKADIDPARFGVQPSSHTAAADARREAIDDLLMQDAYSTRKPILGICYGLQSLNVYHHGSLVQHIPEFLTESAAARVNHEAGRSVPVAHTVEIVGDSRLADIVRAKELANDRSSDLQIKTEKSAARRNDMIVPVNSSHHQSAYVIGEALRVVARCPDDGIIEALEGTSPDHFVLAVQWHPERSVDEDSASRAIFRALVEAAHPRQDQRQELRQDQLISTFKRQ